VDHKLCKDCKGFCCDDFAVSVSPSEMDNSYHNWVRIMAEKGSKESEPIEMLGSRVNTKFFDGIHLTYPMLVFTHQDNIHPDGDIKHNETVYHYKCKHHNKKTGDCDIYEIRPNVCRTYPNNGFCGYKKVTDKRVKAGRPKWFKFGMSYHDWYYEMWPDKKVKEDKPNDECPTEVKAEEAE